MTVYVSDTFNLKFDGIRYYGETVDVNTKFGRFQDLSPMRLGPCKTYGDCSDAKRFENLWQYSLVYQKFMDEVGDPTIEYIEWRDEGWERRVAQLYPMGNTKPLYCYWNDEKIDLVIARKTVYATEYAKNVVKTSAWQDLLNLYHNAGKITLVDCIHGFNYTSDNIALEDLLDYEDIPISNAFILAMMLGGKLEDCIGINMEELIDDRTADEIMGN